MFKLVSLCAVAVLAAGPLSSMAAFQTLWTFSCATTGCQPEAGVTFASGVPHGPTTSGSLYQLALPTGPMVNLHQLNNSPEGAKPVARLTLDSGWLYGTASAGGTLPNAAGAGTIFRIKPTGTFQLLHQFNVPDGREPRGQLLMSPFTAGPAVYGTTRTGGAPGFGNVFLFDIVSLNITAIYNFAGGIDGEFPTTGLIAYNNLLYGTTLSGGAWGGGTLFSINPSLGVKTIHHHFGGPGDGARPSSRLLVVGNALWGTTMAGGSNASGTLYKFNPVTLALNVKHHFASSPSDGAAPSGDLAVTAGKIYGTTQFGGLLGLGTVFRYEPLPQLETVLHDMGTQLGDGAYPTSGVVYRQGLLYGTTSDFPGTVFSQTP